MRLIEEPQTEPKEPNNYVKGFEVIVVRYSEGRPVSPYLFVHLVSYLLKLFLAFGKRNLLFLFSRVVKNLIFCDSNAILENDLS
jgi:hypothetical protein